jgi:hypothetical protein
MIVVVDGKSNNNNYYYSNSTAQDNITMKRSKVQGKAMQSRDSMVVVEATWSDVTYTTQTTTTTATTKKNIATINANKTPSAKA